MAYIYLGQPYSHQSFEVISGRYHKACTFVAQGTRAGITIYSPIVHYHNVAQYANFSTDASFWEQHNFNMLSKAVALWVLTLPGWEESKGLKAEIAEASRLQLPIEYVTLAKG